MSCGGGQKKRTTQAVKLPDYSAIPYYYVHLKGKLGDKQITMDLVKSGPWVFKGFYTFDGESEPLTLWGSLDGDRIVLNENTDSKEERFFTGKIDSTGIFKGIWRGKGTSFPFSLTANFDDAVPFDVFYASDSVKLLPGNPGSPVADATNSLLWPSSSGTDIETTDFIKQTISGGKTVNNIQQFLKRDNDSFLLTYKTAAADIDTSEGIPLTANWSADGDMKVVWNHYPLLSLEYFGFEYTGGAHGNYGANYQVLDLEKKKVVTLDDIFKPEYKTALVPELEKSFRKVFKVDEDAEISTMLLQKEIRPNDNFYMTDKGIAFSYTPYEIAPYALGQVTLFIPFKDIKSLLK